MVPITAAKSPCMRWGSTTTSRTPACVSNGARSPASCPRSSRDASARRTRARSGAPASSAVPKGWSARRCSPDAPRSGSAPAESSSGLVARNPPLVDWASAELMLREASAVGEDFDAWVVGPGLGGGERARAIVEKAARYGQPLVLDADALNAIASDASLRDPIAAPRRANARDAASRGSRAAARMRHRVTFRRIASARPPNWRGRCAHTWC